MNKRSNHIARVDRQTLDKEDFYVTDLWGARTVKMVWCSHHKRYEDIRLFYVQSKTKRKNPSDVRNMCIEAWDMFEGKTIISVSDPAVSLTDFYNGVDND